MMSPRMKSLETCARAAGSAFGFEERDYEARYVAPARPGRVVAFLVAFCGAAAALAHHLGLTGLVASLGGWRASV